MTVINRRKRARIKYQIPAAIHHWNGKIAGVCSLDHSLSGVLLLSPEELFPGEMVDVSFRPANGSPTDARGAVVRCEPCTDGKFRVAVRFHRAHRPLMEYVMLQLNIGNTQIA